MKLFSYDMYALCQRVDNERTRLHKHEAVKSSYDQLLDQDGARHR